MRTNQAAIRLNIILAGLWVIGCQAPVVGSGSLPGSDAKPSDKSWNPNSDGGLLPTLMFPDARVEFVEAMPAAQNILSMRIDPENALLEVARGKPASAAFKAFARMEGNDSVEVDITARTVFYVTDNYLVGGFPADGSPMFSVRIPAKADDPPQRGGIVKVNAKAANSSGTMTTVSTLYTVKLTNVLTVKPLASGAPLPSDPAAAFSGTDAAAFAPQLVYPNDGVLLPPNLGKLEVHWLPGTGKGTLFEVAFKTTLLDVRYYTRCQSEPSLFVDRACVLDLDRIAFDELAQTQKGGASIAVTVRASNESGSVGTSKAIQIRFAKERVDGAVYYWNASEPPQIMRFDFGSQAGLESVLKGASGFGVFDDGGCVGCHTLSHDGKRLAASDGSGFRELYIADLSLPTTAKGRLTVDGSKSPPSMGPGSFDPTNKLMVTSADSDTKLEFFDGETGLLKSKLEVGFNVVTPDWAPDGSMLAVTRIYGTGSSVIQFTEGGISLIKNAPSGFVLPAIDLVPHVVGKNRYNPTFTPDSVALLYSESVEEVGDMDTEVDGYSDPCAKTWAVAAKEGATPIFLAKAGTPSVADTMTLTDGRSKTLTTMLAAGKLMDTYARPTPFVSTLDAHKLMWFTVSSQRRAGLRRFFANGGGMSDATQTLLWMFALDGDQLAAGKDGSYPGFFLPFQDFKTSNHMAQWAQKYVSDAPPPPPPEDPPPPSTPPVTIIP